MRDLASVTAADFQAALGSDFAIAVGESDPLRIRLVDVVVLGERPGHRRPFSLRFDGPPSPVLEHVTHRVSHPKMGEFELFLGPIAGDSERVVYESVFA